MFSFYFISFVVHNLNLFLHLCIYIYMVSFPIKKESVEFEIIKFFLFFIFLQVLFKSFTLFRLQSKPVHGSSDTIVVWEVFYGSDSGNGRATIVNVFHAYVTDICGVNTL